MPLRQCRVTYKRIVYFQPESFEMHQRLSFPLKTLALSKGMSLEPTCKHKQITPLPGEVQEEVWRAEVRYEENTESMHVLCLINTWLGAHVRHRK